MKVQTVAFVIIGMLAVLLFLSILKAEEGAPAQLVNPNFRALPFVFVHQANGSDSDYGGVEPKLLIVQNDADYLAAYKATNKLNYRGPTHDIKPYDPDYVYFFILAGKETAAIGFVFVSQVESSTEIVTRVRCVISKNWLGFPQSSRSPWCAVKVLKKDVFPFTNKTNKIVLLGEVRSEFKVNGERPQ